MSFQGPDTAATASTTLNGNTVALIPKPVPAQPSAQSTTSHNTTSPVPKIPRSNSRRYRVFPNQQFATDYLRHALRSLALQLVLSVIAYVKKRKVLTEEPNIAVFKSVIAFALEILIHLVAIGISIYVVALNWRGKYNGLTMTFSEIDQSFVQVALQTSSKLAELIIVASMAALLCGIIRREVISEHGLPLSGLSAGLDFRDLSYLWSKELWALAFSRQASLYLRFLLVPCLIISCILTSLIGPAIAILIQARSDVWAAGGTTVWFNATAADLYPLLLTGAHLNDTCTLVDSSTADSNCPALGWQSLQTWLELMALDVGAIPNYPKVPGGLELGFRDIIALPVANTRMTIDDPTWPSSNCILPNAAVARALRIANEIWNLAAWLAGEEGAANFVSWDASGRYTNWNDITYSFPRVWSPGVEVSCGVAPYTESATDKVEDCVAFWDNPNYPGERVKSCENPQLADWVRTDFAENWSPMLHWISGNLTLDGTYPDDWNMTTPYSAAAVITLPGAAGNKSIAGCRIHAGYVLTKLWQQSFTNGPALIIPGDQYFGNQPPGQRVPQPPVEPGPGPAIESSWLEYLNPAIPNSNSTVFEQLSASAGVFDLATRQSMPQSRLFEIMLMVLVGNGLARTASHAAPQGAFEYDVDVYTNPEGWWRAWLPAGAVFGRGGNGFKFNISGEMAEEDWLQLHFDVVATGYGYSLFDSAGVKFATTVVLTYVVLAGTLVALSVFRQGFWASTAWKSPVEMIVLALRSSAPDGEFENTSAGINSIETLKKGIRILPVGKRLEIAVVGSKNDSGERIKPNAKYH